MFKSCKIRLELNKKQLSACVGHAGVARHAYNYFLDYCRVNYEQIKKVPSAIDMHKILVAEVKTKYPWYYNYSKCAPHEALRNLEKAYKNFHKKQKTSGYKLFKYKYVNGQKINKGLDGLPQFKKKGQRDSFYLEANNFFKIECNKIKVPKIGWLKTSEQIPLDILIKNVTISRHANHWYISFYYDTQIQKTEKKFSSVGVDLGIKTLATLSDGQVFEGIKVYKNTKQKLRKLQKSLSRKYVAGTESQSSNYKRSKVKLAKAHKKVGDVRKDILHKLTTYLAKTFEIVVIEDLKVKNMVKNHNLASAILDGGFFEFKRQLLYKKEWYGGSVIIANQYFASSKLCSKCKVKNQELKLRDRSWVCKSCGTKHDRDFNAAVNLEHLPTLVDKSTVGFTDNAFGDENSMVGKTTIQLVDELGMKHQMHAFV